MLHVERGNLANSQKDSGYILYNTVLGEKRERAHLEPTPSLALTTDAESLQHCGAYFDPETLVDLRTAMVEAIVECEMVSVARRHEAEGKWWR